jgi:glucose/arabinose dehydrogenase
VGTEDALPTIFTFGNRNPQGLAIHPRTGELWETEHDPMGGDELNVLKPAQNYGWPEITYGRDYSGELVSDYNRRPGMEQPRLFWRPSVAVCGIGFYTGDQFPKWQNRLLVGALRFEEVKLLTIDQGRVQHEEVILKNAGRVRDVATGPDGAIYVVLNRPNSEGIVLRLSVIAERSYAIGAGN